MSEFNFNPASSPSGKLLASVGYDVKRNIFEFHDLRQSSSYAMDNHREATTYQKASTGLTLAFTAIGLAAVSAPIYLRTPNWVDAAIIVPGCASLFLGVCMGTFSAYMKNVAKSELRRSKTCSMQASALRDSMISDGVPKEEIHQIPASFRRRNSAILNVSA